MLEEEIEGLIFSLSFFLSLSLFSNMQDPFPYFERFPDADILTSSDEVVNSVDDDKLEQWDRCKLSLSLSPFF